LEFHQLTYFLAAAQTQNFRKAAELTLTLPALIRPSQIGKDLVLLPISDLVEEFIFALAYRCVGAISHAAQEFINAITQQIVPCKVQKENRHLIEFLRSHS
jgi:DNA-binding transcriptional LysR family regulator